MTTSAAKPGQWQRAAVAVLGLLLLLGAAGCSPTAQGEVVSFSGPTMGTRYQVSVVEPKRANQDAPELETVQQQVDELLARINRQMSTYDPQSELSRFNQHRGDEWFDVSPETVAVVNFALKIADSTGGAFDPTVGPAVNLWGFGPEGKRIDQPTDAEIDEVLTRIGYANLQVRENPPALKKLQPDLYVDLSAIAKGYAVDAVSELLDREGYAASMVEIGGEVRTRGHKVRGQPWKIGVENPQPGVRSLYMVVPLEELALASSGDYRNFFELDGVRYSHSINPATGRPVQHNLATVSVLAPTCMEADALATALLVLGEQTGYDWCKDHDVAALFLVRRTAGIEAIQTPAFAKLDVEPEAQP